MIKKIPTHKITAEIFRKNTGVSNSNPSAQTAKSPVSVSPAFPRSAVSLAAAAGLPADKLSASVVSFARFFSLPLKPESLAAIRRQAFTQLVSEMPQNDSTKQAAADKTSDTAVLKNRTVFSLAAAAAESKGAELQPKGLELFAEAVDPDWHERQDSGGQNNKQRNSRNQNEKKDENVLTKTVPINASSLKEMALESAEKNPSLYILNRLPDKDGRRWIVIPFSFSEENREFRVSMRILLEPERVLNHASYMALDISESGQRRLFILESAGGKPIRLSVYFQGELPPKAQSSIKRELSGLFGIPLERISVKGQYFSDMDDLFPLEAGFGEDQFSSIDEAV